MAIKLETYDELMRRRELMFADWMRRVEAGLEFYSHGIILGPAGQLRMTAFSMESDTVLWELSTKFGDALVTITYPDGTTYQV